ncbi:hypothetical protein [Kitasatospora camelliae]|uniref:Golgi phosphoprotein 3 GPP34 n=1 Tax=Kitasatospora camelliae TaxID=3156397 RepID=A0AAU8K4K3_9ACTN
MGERWAGPESSWEPGPVGVGLLRLAAAGLLAADGRPAQEDAAGDRDGRALLQGWLSGPEDPGDEGILAVVAWLARRAATLIVETHGGDPVEAKAWLGDRAETVRADGGPFPAEPTALALTWLAVDAIEPEDQLPHAVPPARGDAGPGRGARCFADRCEQFIRPHDPARDACALALTTARIGATALLAATSADHGRIRSWLDEQAARALPPTRSVPAWIPRHPGALTEHDTSN